MSTVLSLGIVLDDADAKMGRRADPVDWLLLRQTLLNMPREGGARHMRESLKRRHPNAALVPYAWHYLTHGPGDGLQERASRRLAGDWEGHLVGGRAAEAWASTLRCMDGLGADRVVLRTPPSFGPGALSRTRLQSFVSERPQTHFLWEAQGLWEPAECHRFGASHGFEAMVPATGVTGRLTQWGGARWLLVGNLPGGRLSAQLAEILVDELLEDAQPGRVLLFDGPFAHRNLRTLAAALPKD